MELARIDLNLLVVLDAVLAERSVSGAARRLHVTPSAVSNSLARLRSLFGDPLVSRNGRGIVATPRGAELAPQLAHALGELTRVIDRSALDPATTARQFTLAIADATQLVRVPALVARFAKTLPRARLRIVGIDTLIATGGLAGAEVDVAVAVFESDTPGVKHRPLYTERALLAAREGHPFARRKMTHAQLAAARHVDVQLAPGRGYRDLDPAYARIGIRRDVAVVVPSFSAAAAMLGVTDFVATLPEAFIGRFADSLHVRPLRSPAPALELSIRLAWHERTDRDPLMTLFRELVLETLLASKGSGGRSGIPARAVR